MKKQFSLSLAATIALSSISSYSLATPQVNQNVTAQKQTSMLTRRMAEQSIRNLMILTGATPQELTASLESGFKASGSSIENFFQTSSQSFSDLNDAGSSWLLAAAGGMSSAMYGFGMSSLLLVATPFVGSSMLLMTGGQGMTDADFSGNLGLRTPLLIGVAGSALAIVATTSYHAVTLKKLNSTKLTPVQVENLLGVESEIKKIRNISATYSSTFSLTVEQEDQLSEIIELEIISGITKGKANFVQIDVPAIMLKHKLISQQTFNILTAAQKVQNVENVKAIFTDLSIDQRALLTLKITTKALQSLQLNGKELTRRQQDQIKTALEASAAWLTIAR